MMQLLKDKDALEGRGKGQTFIMTYYYALQDSVQRGFKDGIIQTLEAIITKYLPEQV